MTWKQPLAALSALFIAAGLHAAVITVGEGEVLSQRALESGVFNDIEFELGEGTIFDVAGGAIGPFGQRKAPLDFRGSEIRIRDGGVIKSMLWPALPH